MQGQSLRITLRCQLDQDRLARHHLQEIILPSKGGSAAILGTAKGERRRTARVPATPIETPQVNPGLPPMVGDGGDQGTVRRDGNVSHRIVKCKRQHAGAALPQRDGGSGADGQQLASSCKSDEVGGSSV